MADEAKLLMRLKSKKRNSIDEAVRVYTPYLSTVLYNMAGNRLLKEDIEEIVSDVFVALWRNAEYINPEKGSVRAYIAAVARNFALKRLTGKANCACIDDIEIADETSASEEKAVNSTVWDAVMSLGEPDSEIFVRYYKYDEKLKDISRATGINISTVKTKLSRGKRKLKIILSNAEEML